MGSSNLDNNSCRPAEIIPEVVNPLSAAVNSDNLEFLPGLRLDFRFVKLECG
jgi:hypothetical protein